MKNVVSVKEAAAFLNEHFDEYVSKINEAYDSSQKEHIRVGFLKWVADCVGEGLESEPETNVLDFLRNTKSGFNEWNSLQNYYDALTNAHIIDYVDWAWGSITYSVSLSVAKSMIEEKFGVSFSEEEFDEFSLEEYKDGYEIGDIVSDAQCDSRFPVCDLEEDEMIDYLDIRNLTFGDMKGILCQYTF